MEDIDGGLHPAVDGQSLDEMMRKGTKQRPWETTRAQVLYLRYAVAGRSTGIRSTLCLKTLGRCDSDTAQVTRYR